MAGSAVATMVWSTGAWAGHDHTIAAWQDGGWQFSVPQTGWSTFVADEGALLLWNGTAWVDFISTVTAIQNLALLGVGTGGWGVQRRLFEGRIYPHNIFVEVMCEYGIGMVGMLAAYFGWLAWRAYLLARTPLPRRQAIYASGLVACLAFWFLSVQVSGDVIDNRNLWIFAVLVEIATRVAAHVAPEKQESLAGA